MSMRSSSFLDGEHDHLALVALRANFPRDVAPREALEVVRVKDVAHRQRSDTLPVGAVYREERIALERPVTADAADARHGDDVASGVGDEDVADPVSLDRDLRDPSAAGGVQRRDDGGRRRLGLVIVAGPCLVETEHFAGTLAREVGDLRIPANDHGKAAVRRLPHVVLHEIVRIPRPSAAGQRFASEEDYGGHQPAEQHPGNTTQRAGTPV
jgi:hypothetical protein